MNPQVLHCACKPDKREEDVAFSMMLFQCVSKLNSTFLGSHFQKKKNILKTRLCDSDIEGVHENQSPDFLPPSKKGSAL